MVKKITTVAKGLEYESAALAFLLENGLSLRTRNYHSRYGELDLVMQDKTSLVVVEVRYRKNNTYGSPLESVTAAKQKRIKLTTEYYLAMHKLAMNIRFDVVGFTGDNAPEWIKNAL